VDFGVLNNRLTGAFEVYQRETENLINEIGVQSGANFTNRLFTNVGTMEINGWEVGINGILVDNEDWRVSLGANVTHNDIEITELTLVDDPNFPGVETGDISGINTRAQIHSVGFHRSTFWQYEQIYDQDGNPVDGLYVDQNGDGVVNNSDRVRSENPDPDYLFGFNGQFGYKNFTLGFNGRLSVGNYAYNDVSAARNSFGGVWNSSGYIENTVANFGQQNFTQSQPLSDHWLEDASFFRMDNITLGYNVDSFLSEKIDASFSFTVQNAFLITDYSGVDPELNNGIDNNLYPRPRNFVLGLNLNFR